MATGLENYPNINPVSVDYPFGDLKDKTSGSGGTPINRLTNADIHQTFAKILDAAGETANGLPENATNGYQYFDALNSLFGTTSDEDDGAPSPSLKIFTAIRSQSQLGITNVVAGSENITSFATKSAGVINISTEISFQADAGASINLGRLQLDIAPKYHGIWDDINKKLSISGMARTTNSSTPPTHIYIDSVDDSNNLSNSILRITTLGLTVFPSANGQSTILTFQMSYKAKNTL